MFSKLMFNRETIAFGQRATIDSDEKTYSDEERAIVKSQIDHVYSQFLELVAKARKITPEEVTIPASHNHFLGEYDGHFYGHAIYQASHAVSSMQCQ